MQRLIPKLNYTAESKSVPMKLDETSLQTITAVPWIKISDDRKQLEGLCFDRNGDLYFLEVFGGHIMKLEVDTMAVKDIYVADGLKPAAIKIHKNGRLYIAFLGNFVNNGGIFSIEPDGSDFRYEIGPEKGFVIDDLVFTSDGGYYFTQFTGYTFDPTGGVYYVSPEGEITKIAGNMAGANGIALSKDEDVLWVTETNNNKLNRIKIRDRVTIPPYGAHVPYRFTGCNGPDSCCIDDDNNLYVAIAESGRCMIFNFLGYPIGQILMPEREDGHMLISTHPCLRPDTDEVIICANDGDFGGHGSWLFRARGFAENFKGSYQYL